MVAIVYLVHFDRPYFHAQHYLGSTVDLARRIEQHRSGQGSPLLAAVSAAGIHWRVVRTWKVGGRIREAVFKRRQHNRELCPVCAARENNYRPGRNFQCRENSKTCESKCGRSMRATRRGSGK